MTERARCRATGWWRMPRTMRALALIPLGLAAPGCRGFEPPHEQTLARLGAMPLAAALAGQAQLELESPGLSGVFDAVWGEHAEGFRVQLFPDVGGKVLDVRFSARSIEATTPDGDYRAGPPLEAAAPHLAVVLALVFAELGTPVTPDRVLGERRGDAGLPCVLLRPALGAGSSTAQLDATGRVQRYRLGLGRVELELDGDGRFVGRGFRGRLWP